MSSSSCCAQVCAGFWGGESALAEGVLATKELMVW